MSSAKIDTKVQEEALVAAVKQWFRERHAERQVDAKKKDNTTFRWFRGKKKVRTVVVVISCFLYVALVSRAYMCTCSRKLCGRVLFMYTEGTIMLYLSPPLFE